MNGGEWRGELRMFAAFVGFAVAVSGAEQPSVRHGVYTVPSQVDFEGETSCISQEVARGAEIVAIGAYEGGLPLSKLATHEGNSVKGIAVSSAANGGPLVLVLTAYDPVVWDVSAVSKRRLRAVIVSGYHAQAVVGAGGTPVRITSVYQPNPACGDANFAYKGGSNLDQLDASVRERFGRGIGRFKGSYTLKGVAVDGQPIAAPAAVPLAGAIGASAYSTGMTLDGPLGLQRLQAKGFIRRATRADADKLGAILTAKSKTGHLAPVRPYLEAGETYVVLRPIEVPTGMYGGNSATFLLPSGVPFPNDPGSHNTYWSMETAECRGPGCNVDD
jgi:hypothetical protein